MTDPTVSSPTSQSEAPSPASPPKRAMPFEAVLGRHASNVIFTNLFGLAILLFLAWACLELGDASARARMGYALTGLAGTLLGWACGMYFAPYGPSERSRFVTVGQAASAFASGYLVSKLDRFLETTLFPQPIGTPGEWLGAALFAVAFLNAALVVYSNRAYFREH